MAIATGKRDEGVLIGEVDVPIGPRTCSGSPAPARAGGVEAARDRRPALPPPPPDFSGLVGTSRSGPPWRPARTTRRRWRVGALDPDRVRHGSLEGFKLPAVQRARASVYENDAQVTGADRRRRLPGHGRVQPGHCPTEPGKLVLPETKLVTFSPSRGDVRDQDHPDGDADRGRRQGGRGRGRGLRGPRSPRGRATPAVVLRPRTPGVGRPRRRWHRCYRPCSGSRRPRGCWSSPAPGSRRWWPGGRCGGRLGWPRRARRRSWRSSRRTRWSGWSRSRSRCAGSRPKRRRSGSGRCGCGRSGPVRRRRARSPAGGRSASAGERGGAVIVGLLWAMACSKVVGDGSAAFDAGQLDQAITVWSGAGGSPSGVVQYDLGVARYRSGDFPRAVARFRGAARLRPRDGNVQHDLALSRSELDSGVPPPVSLASWTQVLTPGELGLLGFLVTGLGSLLTFPRRTRLGGAATLAVGLASGLLGSWAAFDQRAHPVAVVVDQTLILRDAASVNAGERLRLPPGTEVRVERKAGEFLLVVDGRDRRGWAPANGLDLAWRAGPVRRRRAGRSRDVAGPGASGPRGPGADPGRGDGRAAGPPPGRARGAGRRRSVAVRRGRGPGGRAVDPRRGVLVLQRERPVGPARGRHPVDLRGGRVDVRVLVAVPRAGDRAGHGDLRAGRAGPPPPARGP